MVIYTLATIGAIAILGVGAGVVRWLYLVATEPPPRYHDITT